MPKTEIIGLFVTVGANSGEKMDLFVWDENLKPNAVNFKKKIFLFLAPFCKTFFPIFLGTDNTPLMGTGCVNDGNDVLTVCGQCAVLFDVCYPIGVGYVPK